MPETTPTQFPPGPWPQPDDPDLSEAFPGIDQTGAEVLVRVPAERAATILLDGQEVVTLMTVGDHPRDLALGYLLNQGLLDPGETVLSIDVDRAAGRIAVTTGHLVDRDERLAGRLVRAGCGQGTSVGLAGAEIAVRSVPAAPLRTSWLHEILRRVNTAPSLYLAAGSIHGCVLAQGPEVLCYMEDVGRHNAIDKVAGWMARTGIPAADAILYTTGRLTAEMVMKVLRMGVPVAVSRSGFTTSGLDLGRRAGLLMVARARGKRFVVVSGAERMVFDRVPVEGGGGA
ncbi:formate dehydrogenase accessory sulfurtransferase FdhD [Antarcticirhabdus aurantiaca]|uniref:Formate dehydrogenase accessory sulfurtransferase FdhD n=1 Tax=Antarcticirhabdus aurantiaca TaxID=2606717 RepID=A0ACD4NVC6_9HYPH|nr:formate dehydrogenase accessory sulfurtransferase FdhD [Antarcticirhabdus aurantiaca]WAJ30786.1 formate dehydrogenase accessory sulfurtransferase FdhD [Jeongeuplla avenae]